ncbi:glycerophosphodiester phosphodiesterase [Uliginosibacterium flavum]|uniref:Glycerophosphodiester phosphodiesterase n=1 Tax=Uliginosibacterium flavum TaxID=1396831 RepID=A0ABV2TP79_9RHOO
MKIWPYPRVIAHRCGGALAPENTLAGLTIAAQLGCRGVEFDVMLSAEGSPWLIHDETLERTSNGTGRVCDSPDATLAALDAGAWHHPAFAGERLPTLLQALATCQALGLAANIEIKPAAAFEAETGRVVSRFVRDFYVDMPEYPLLSSFSEDALRAARLEAPLQPLALLVDEIPPDWQDRCAQLGVIAVHTNSTFLSAEDARAIKAAGYALAVYTEDDPLRAAELFGWGVDSVITDRPDRVRA